MQDILPGIINQLGKYGNFHVYCPLATLTTTLRILTCLHVNIVGPDNLDNLRKLAEQFQKQAPGAGGAGAANEQDDDDDVPDLVEGQTFEAAAEESHPPAPAPAP